ncbi:MAG: response regulator transcription factor [Cephaloticoccus sp.]|nr:response regulator transcription factor [Cephaloticoccus sp.]MCF7761877.1 response regulator transcription factor [Cephaloticoccus sp.]
MTAPSSSAHVLLVDDEAYFRTFVGKVLSKSFNCTISEAMNGQQAIDMCRTKQPDLILLDINLPLVNGVEALRQIRRFNADVPIVMLTSISEEAVVEECVTLEASYFIRKDVYADQLKSEIKAMLEMFFPTATPAHE